MAKQDKKEDPIGLAMGALLLLIGIIYLCAPLALIILCAYFTYVWKKGDLSLYKSRRFWLSSSEQDYFHKVAIIVNEGINQKESALQSANDEGIGFNKDGRITARSYRGKDLKRQFEEAQQTIEKYKPIYQELQEQPLKNYKSARAHYSRSYATFAALIGYFIACLKDLILYGDFLRTYRVSFNILGSKKNEFADESSFFASIGIVLLFYVATRIFYAIKFNKNYEEPPLVTLDNYNTYHRRFNRSSYRKTEQTFQTGSENASLKQVEKLHNYSTLDKLQLLEHELSNTPYDRKGIWENCVLFFELDVDFDANGNLCQGNRNKSIVVDIEFAADGKIHVSVFTRENKQAISKQIAEQVFGEFKACSNNPSRHCAISKEVDFNDKDSLSGVLSEIRNILKQVHSYRDKG